MNATLLIGIILILLKTELDAVTPSRYDSSFPGLPVCSMYPLQDIDSSRIPPNECLASDMFNIPSLSVPAKKRACTVRKVLGDVSQLEYLIIQEGTTVSFFSSISQNGAIFSMSGYPQAEYIVPNNNNTAPNASDFDDTMRGVRVRFNWAQNRVSFLHDVVNTRKEPYDLLIQPPFFVSPISVVLSLPSGGFLNITQVAQVTGFPGPDYKINNAQGLLRGKFVVSQNLILDTTSFGSVSVAKIEGDCYPLLRDYLILMYLKLVPRILPGL